MPSNAHWMVLERLFAGETAAFRHQLSLARSSASDFYAGTPEAAEIRAEKRAILSADHSGRYLVTSAEGTDAADEFLRTIGLSPEGQDADEINRAATLALEPDFILVAPPDWRLVWASVCFPTRWSLEGKQLQPLNEIHGVVPGLNAELGRKIDIFFGRLNAGEGWGRANWGLSTSAARNQHPGLPYVALQDRTAWESVYVRLESQHLQKLPETGAIAFGIRILSFPATELAGRPGVAAALKERLRTMPGEVAAYKGIPPDFWCRF